MIKTLSDFVGYGEENNPGTITEDFLQDVKRVKYIESYSEALATAIRY